MLPSCPAADMPSLSALATSAANEFKRTWQEGKPELYAPLHTYHRRSSYDASKIAGFNENLRGADWGKGYKDTDRTWRGVYAMAFLDSHSKIEPIAGYARIYEVASHAGISAGLGFIVFLTGRKDIDHYAPIPGILPLASLAKGRASLMATYLPGSHNNGNVIFIFMKYSLSR